MSSDDELKDPDWDRSDPSVVVAIAEGILVERYQIPASMAAALLRSFATAAGMPLIETAHWLMKTGRLP